MWFWTYPWSNTGHRRFKAKAWCDSICPAKTSLWLLCEGWTGGSKDTHQEVILRVWTGEDSGLDYSHGSGEQEKFLRNMQKDASMRFSDWMWAVRERQVKGLPFLIWETGKMEKPPTQIQFTGGGEGFRGVYNELIQDTMNLISLYASWVFTAINTKQAWVVRISVAHYSISKAGDSHFISKAGDTVTKNIHTRGKQSSYETISSPLDTCLLNLGCLMSSVSL